MSRVLPILFNTDMVQAILGGRKTVTRRIVKYKYSNTEMKMRTDKYGTRLIEIQKDIEGETHGKYPDGSTWHKVLPYIEKNPPYRKGDVLYVRETWCNANKEGVEADYYYYADTSLCEDYDKTEWKWKPSIHMPKEAARIWLKVTDVRVERIQDIMKDPSGPSNQVVKEGCRYGCDFIAIWENTIKKSEKDLYGWEANPFVWVIEFERCEKPEET